MAKTCWWSLDISLDTCSQTSPPWVRQVQESINGIRKELSALAEIKRNDNTEYRNRDGLGNNT